MDAVRYLQVLWTGEDVTVFGLCDTVSSSQDCKWTEALQFSCNPSNAFLGLAMAVPEGVGAAHRQVIEVSGKFFDLREWIAK